MNKRYDSNDGPLGKAPNIGVGFSDAFILTISLIGFVFLGWTIYSIILAKTKTARELEAEDQDVSYEDRLAQADVSTLNRSQRRARARIMMKKNRRANTNQNNLVPPIEVVGDGNEQQQQQQQQQQQNLLLEQQQQQQHDEGIPPFQDESHHSTAHTMLSRKERQKAAKQVELQERKMFEEDRRKEQQEALNAAKSKKREKEKMVAIQIEQDRKERLEQRQADGIAKYHAWRILFVENNTNQNDEESITVLEWIQEMKQNRIVTLKDMATRFRVSPDRVRERIMELIHSSRISGIIEHQDENNENQNSRFIYLSPDDMSRLASFVKLRGKITTKEFASQIQEKLQLSSG
jgi:hypothetical protein